MLAGPTAATVYRSTAHPERALAETSLPKGASPAVAPSWYGTALRRSTTTFSLLARTAAGSGMPPGLNSPPPVLARYSTHLSGALEPTVQARAQRVADPRHVRQMGEARRGYGRSDLRVTRPGAGGFLPVDPRNGASAQRSWSGPRRSLSAAVAHPGLIPGGAPVPTGAPVLQRGLALQRALVLQRERELVMGPAPAVHGPPVLKRAIVGRTTPLEVGVGAVSTAGRPAVSTAERPAPAIPVSSPSALRRPDHRLRGGLASPVPGPTAPLPTGPRSPRGRLLIASERDRPLLRRDTPVRPATPQGPGMAQRQYLARSTWEMRPGAAANWPRTTKESAAVPKLPGSLAVLPGSAARVPAAAPPLGAAAAALARRAGAPARAVVEMRGPSNNSATMGLTAEQRAAAKASSRTPSPAHRPPVPLALIGGAVHRLTTRTSFLPSSEAPSSQGTVMQSWPGTQLGDVVSRERPQLARHRELGLTPSPVDPGRVRARRGGPTRALRTGGRTPSRGSLAAVPIVDAEGRGRMSAGLSGTAKRSVTVTRLPGSVGMFPGRAAHLPVATPPFVTAGVGLWPATQPGPAMRPGRPRLLRRHNLALIPPPAVPRGVLGRAASQPIATSPGVLAVRTPTGAAGVRRWRTGLPSTGLPSTGLPSTGLPSTGLISVGPKHAHRTTTDLTGVRSVAAAPTPSLMSTSPRRVGAMFACPTSAGLPNASLTRARVVGAAPMANVMSADPTIPGLTDAARREAGPGVVGLVAVPLIGAARKNAGRTSAGTANAGFANAGFANGRITSGGRAGPSVAWNRLSGSVLVGGQSLLGTPHRRVARRAVSAPSATHWIAATSVSTGSQSLRSGPATGRPPAPDGSLTTDIMAYRNGQLRSTSTGLALQPTAGAVGKTIGETKKLRRAVSAPVRPATTSHTGMSATQVLGTAYLPVVPAINTLAAPRSGTSGAGRRTAGNGTGGSGTTAGAAVATISSPASHGALAVPWATQSTEAKATARTPVRGQSASDVSQALSANLPNLTRSGPGSNSSMARFSTKGVNDTARIGPGLTGGMGLIGAGLTGGMGEPTATTRGDETSEMARPLPVETSERPPPAEQFDMLAEALAAHRIAETERRGLFLRPDVF